MPINAVSLVTTPVRVKAIVRTPFKDFIGDWNVQSRAIEDSYRQQLVIGPQVRMQEVDFFVASDSSGLIVKPNLIFEAIKRIDFRTCCFWELSWVGHVIQYNNELWNKMTPLVALSNPFPADVTGEGRKFVVLRGNFGSPVLNHISETSIGIPGLKYLISQKGNPIPNQQSIAA